MSTPEDIKLASHYLRGTVAEELANDESTFGSDSTVLLKFHGIYQQDDRDVRRTRTAARQPLDYSCMVRAAIPGGVVSLEQWLALDSVADLANGTLRITTRQGVQFHVVVKDSLHQLVADINRCLLTTLAACGDVVRNTMACPAPHADGRQAILQPALDAIVARFRPHTASYWEIWADGERAVTAEPATGDVVEPVYGTTYLPRKFKIGLAWPGDNCVDVYTHDVGLVPTLSEGTTGEVTGWVVLVGGGLGMSHAREDDTYPRLATPLAWVTPEQLVDTVEAVVTTQRDHGNRADRHRARLKYLVDERGIDWMRAEVEARLGYVLADPVELLPWVDADEHHGWTPDPNGRWTLGVPIASGRVGDDHEVTSRAALRELAGNGLVSEIRLTARQDVLLCGIADADRPEVERVLGAHGVAIAHQITPVRRLAIACPALPTCGQALGEAERVLPFLVDGIEKTLSSIGRPEQAMRINMTGCPNGCARPYSAEIGIVGRTKTTYDVYLGGSATGERLAERIRTDVALDDVAALLEPVLSQYAGQGRDGETFGDYCHRLGTASIATLLPEPKVRRRRRGAEAEAEAD